MKNQQFRKILLGKKISYKPQELRKKCKCLFDILIEYINYVVNQEPIVLTRSSDKRNFKKPHQFFFKP